MNHYFGFNVPEYPKDDERNWLGEARPQTDLLL